LSKVTTKICLKGKDMNLKLNKMDKIVVNVS
jgi:hypothetical protein